MHGWGSEVRARTLRTREGGTLAGRSVVDGLMHGALVQLTRQRPREQRDDLRARLAESMSHVANPSGLLERFEALETHWDPPSITGYEPADAAAAS